MIVCDAFTSNKERSHTGCILTFVRVSIYSYILFIRTFVFVLAHCRSVSYCGDPAEQSVWMAFGGQKRLQLRDSCGVGSKLVALLRRAGAATVRCINLLRYQARVVADQSSRNSVVTPPHHLTPFRRSLHLPCNFLFCFEEKRNCRHR